MSALALNEQARLDACEKSIEQGIAVFVEVGRALTEIRDSKLYRASHKTFEAYCKDRWEIGRTRAYDLIDQAKVTDALSSAGVVLSPSATNDGVSRNDARIIKNDPSAIVAIRERVEGGEKPADAVKAVAVEKKAEKAEQQAGFDRQRADAAANLPAHAQASIARTAEHRAAAKPALPEGDDIEALKAELSEKADYIEALEADLSDARRTIAKFDDMVAEYERGGFENVIAGLEQRIEILSRQVERESQEKVANLRSAAYWKQKAIDAGANDDVVIDMATGDMTRG